MKVKMLSVLAGPTVCAAEGQVVELDDSFAQSLIDGGYAVEHQPKVKASQTQPELELAETLEELLPLNVTVLDELPQETRDAIRAKIEAGEIDPLNLPEGLTPILDGLVDNTLIVEEAQLLAEEKALAEQAKTAAETTDAEAGQAAETNAQATEAAATSKPASAKKAAATKSTTTKGKGAK